MSEIVKTVLVAIGAITLPIYVAIVIAIVVEIFRRLRDIWRSRK